MKILVIGDLHGRKPRIHFKDFDAIIQVGDVCDDRKFRPYVRRWFKHLKSGGEKISLSLYLDRVLGKRKIKKLDKDSLRVGNELLKYLGSFGKPLFFVPGNWDQSYGETKIKDADRDDYSYYKSFLDSYYSLRTNPGLIKGVKNLVDCQMQKHEFGGLNFIGFGLSSNAEKPDFKKKNFSKEEKKKITGAYYKLEKTVSSLFKKRNKKFPTIYLSHNVPARTKLDYMGSGKNKKHLGSVLSRKICEIYKPLICIGGHMHERQGVDKIGKTTIVNAGYGKDANVLIEIDGNKIKKIKFYKK